MPLTPLDAAEDVMDRADSVITHAQTLPTGLLREDLFRLAHAYAVAGLDTYMHVAIGRIELNKIPAALGKLDVPFSDLIDLADSTVKNRGKKTRPKVKARHALQRRLFTETFQSPKKIEDGFLMLGHRNAFHKIQQHIQPQMSKNDIRTNLSRVVSRRNAIVHEGDIARQQRPQVIKRQLVDESQIIADITWIRSLVVAIDQAL